MVTFLIDAFNLFHKIRDINESKEPHRDLLQYLKMNRFTGSVNNEVVVVFDGYKKEDLPAGGFHLLYSNNRRADDLIKEKVEKSTNPRQLTVVSDDREIRDYAKLHGAVVCRIDEFLQKRSKPAKSKGGSSPRRSGERLDEATRREINSELEKLWLDKK